MRPATSAFRRNYLRSRDRATLELTVFGTLYGAWIALNYNGLGFELWVIGAVMAATALYAVAQILRYSDIHHIWGFCAHGISRAGAECALMVFLCLLPVGVMGAELTAGELLPHLKVTPAPYLLWCVVQDFVFFSFFARHLEKLLPSSWMVCLVAGAFFGAVHLPFGVFAALTFLGGTVWAWIFLRTGSLLPIVGAHWILGMALLVRF